MPSTVTNLDYYKAIITDQKTYGVKSETTLVEILALFRLRLFQRPNRGIGAFHFGKRHRLAADILIVLGRRSKTAGPDRRKPGAAEGKEHKPASAPPSNNGTPAKITRPTDRRGFAGQDGVGIHAKPSHDRTDAANDGAKLSAVVAAR